VVSRLHFFLSRVVPCDNDYQYNVHHPHNDEYVHHFSPFGSIGPICVLSDKERQQRLDSISNYGENQRRKIIALASFTGS